MAGGAEAHALALLGGVGALVVVGRDQRVGVDQVVGLGQLSGAGVVAHGLDATPQRAISAARGGAGVALAGRGPGSAAHTRARLAAMWLASTRARSTWVFVHACGARR